MSQVVKIKAGGYHLKYQNPGSLEADQEAEKDAKEYLTTRQRIYLFGEIRGGCKFSRIRFMCGLVGISGYPVSALIRLHHPRFLSRFGKRRT